MIVNMSLRQYDPATMVRVDRQTKWGTPFDSTQLAGGKEQAIKFYRTHLWKMIQTREVTIPELAKTAREET